jgi:uncharacterized protein (TIGR02646 family)
MEPFQRGPIPTRLSDLEQVAAWTADWVNSERAFGWHGAREEIVEAVHRDTNNHCSYCDARWPDPTTIDHLRPKDIFRLLAYDWNNLYLCCFGCQRTVGPFTDEVVVPDAATYRFDDFFFVDSAWKLQAVVGPNNSRAVKTIEYFKLNKAGRGLPLKRKRAFAEQHERPRPERDYRYLWQADQVNDQGIGVNP